MKIQFLILLIAAVQTIGQTNRTVVPAGFENQAGNTSDSILFTQSQIQQLFRASALQWDGPVQITGVAFRVTDGTSSFSAVVPRIEIYMSTSALAPERLTPNYFSNRGPDETAVFLRDNVFLIGRAGQNVNPFDLRVTFDQPFTYDSSRGNLLMYIKTFGSGVGARNIDSQIYAGNLANSPVVSTGTSAPFGGIAGYALINEFSTVAVPEPSVGCLILLGTIVCIGKFVKRQ